ncbi:DUF3466 family protein [Aquabacterium sp. A7-Y]|uniref:hypothetical protein n=1 Tax=Aquabacterium sp. A7-Y TaxID=1349605 RepID=UPI00223D64B0|nr:hypothetical protein [Aquabacterium sp. A7-Y]MCW7540372.1 DUF3466 family protein [Aquabacterium sp. A7-Y]
MTRPRQQAVRRYLVAVVAALLALNAQAEPNYRIVVLDLVPSPFDDIVRAVDLNDHGQVVGYTVEVPDGSTAVSWGRDGRAQALPHLPFPGWEQRAFGINQRGQIVGFDETYRANREEYPTGRSCVLWTVGGGVKVLRGLGEAYAINDHGDVVGSSRGRAALLDHRGGVRDLGSLPTYPQGWGQASAINNARQVVGFAEAMALPEGTVAHAFFWSEATGMQDLGARLGPPNMSSYANAINERGQVVGTSYSGDGRSQAFVWSEQDGLLRLGGPRDAMSAANDINNAGVVAGSVNDEAVLWSRSSGLQKLIDLVDPADPLRQRIQLRAADAINNLGEVTATATLPDSDDWAFWPRAVLLIPHMPQGAAVRAGQESGSTRAPPARSDPPDGQGRRTADVGRADAAELSARPALRSLSADR